MTEHDKQAMAAGRLVVHVVGNINDMNALREAGVSPVRIVDRPEDLYDERHELTSDMSIFNRYVLAYGKDEAELRDAVAIRLGDERCSWIDWTDDVPSASAVLERLGPEDVAEFIKGEHRPMWLDEVCRMSDIPPEPAQQSFRTGFKLLDEHGFRLVRPAFMPVIGPYASGKSVFLRQLACNLWRLHGWRTLITSFEEKVRPRYERDFRKFLIAGNDDGPRYSSASIEETFTDDQIRAADREIDQAFRFLRRSRNALMDADRLIDRIRFAVRVYGVEVVMIDPVNEIDHMVPRNMTKTDYMGHFIMQLKQLADDYKLLMIVAAHPPKDGVARRAGPRIYTLNDGADTAHYGNKADIGWTVWRPTMQGATYLNIDKCKDTEIMGDPTFARLDFDKYRGRFSVTRVGEDVIAEIIGAGDDQ